MKGIEEMPRAGAEAIVIVTGANSRARLSNEARSYAAQDQLQLHTLSAYETVPKFYHQIDLGKWVAAIIHITC